jgi:hypothetical protein
MIKLMVRCIILAGWGFTTAAIAIELPEQILACRTIADAIARAECYDRAVDALAQPAEIPEPLATTPPKPPAPPKPPKPKSSPTPSIAPTLSVAAEPAPTDPEAEVVELKQQVADLEQQVAIPAQKETREAETESTTEPGSAFVSPEDLFGKEDTESRETVRKLFGLRDVDEIEATLAEVKRTPYGKLVLVLDNGQIWAQIDTNRLRVKPGDAVRIKAARLGSFLLEKQTGSRLIRVKRVD